MRWRASFVFLFMFAIMSLISSYFLLQETLPKQRRVPIQLKLIGQRFKAILSDGVFNQNTFHASVGLTVLFTFCCISSYLLISDLHVSQAQYGISFSSNATIFIIASVLSTQFCQRVSLKFSIHLGAVVLLLGAMVMLLVNALQGLSVLHFMAPMWILTCGAGLMMGPAVALALEKFP